MVHLPLNVTVVTGSATARVIPELAKLRIAIFREYPYLYEGSAEYEERYLRRYARSEQCIVVLVSDGGRIVGASTGMPLHEEASEVVEPIAHAGYKVKDWFYFAESVLLPEYRGLGLGHRFFAERLKHASDLGFRHACFCAVSRPDNHPMRPAGYRPLDDLWKKHGFMPSPDVQTTFTWQEIGENAATPKPMAYWVRTL